MLNAIEASPENSAVELSTVYRLNLPRAEVVIGVRDQGEGVCMESADSIFEPFYTTKSQGTGLGLTNVKRVVVAHGGRVEFDRRITRGAAFYLVLPMGGYHGQNTHH